MRHARVAALTLCLWACGDDEPERSLPDAAAPLVDASLDAALDAGAIGPDGCIRSDVGSVCPFDPRAGASLVLPADADRTEALAVDDIDLRTIHRIERHGRGKAACQLHPREGRVLCATDELADDWSIVGTRVFAFSPVDFTIEEALVGTSLHSSYLWGDFDQDGNPDFFGFSDQEEPQDHNAVLYLATGTPLEYEAVEPFAIDFPVKGGAVIDVDGDGCEDVLVLGTAREDWNAMTFDYFPDALYRGDCAGGFTLANDEVGLDAVPGFVGGPSTGNSYGRSAAVADLGLDACPDLVVGNYRAQPNAFLESDCAGGLHRWVLDPDDDPFRTYFGHTVALIPYDVEGRDVLDLYVFNLWHPDERGELLDEAHLMRFDASGEFTRDPIGYFLEAPFGVTVADFDADRVPELLMATGHRWEDYRGDAALLRDDEVVWQDDGGWLQLREVPIAVDLNLDGAIDLFADGRVLANYGAQSSWIGFVFAGRPLGGARVTVVDDAGRRLAFSLASDGRGQPSNLLTVGLGADARPAELVLQPFTGAARTLSLEGLEPDRAYVVELLER